MKTYIALLRGINVSGQKKILMADLRELLENAGLDQVRTYIQSGNVVFNSVLEPNECETIVFNAIQKHYGWDVPILVRTSEDIAKVLKNCPFSGDKKEKSYFTLLHSKPNEDHINKAKKASNANEEFVITPQCVYMFYASGAGKAKLTLNWFERNLGVKATSRNFRTLTKLLQMANS